MQLVAVSTRRQTAASIVSAAIRSGLQPVRSLSLSTLLTQVNVNMSMQDGQNISFC